MRKMIISFGIGIIFIIFASQSVSAETYTVKKGDNLWNISAEHDIRVSKLMEINELDKVTIHPEQELYIYETYEIERGDTLSEIAKEYSVTVEHLQEWNELSSDLIFAGEDLIIHAMHDDIKEKTKKQQAKKATEKQTAKKETKNTATTNKATAKKEMAKKAEPKSDKGSEQQPSGKTLTVTATAYTAKCDGCSGVTYTGIDLNKDRQAKVIAVDPNVIPLGTKVHVDGYGEAIAGDIGGAIKGNKIDIHVPTKDEAYQWGVRTVDVTLLD